MYARIDALEDRTRKFATAALRYGVVLRSRPGLIHPADQLTRAAGSVGANHRAMRRARSLREFAARLQTVVEEADECVYWLEVVTDLHAQLDGTQELLREARALRAIFVKARSTTRAKLR